MTEKIETTLDVVGLRTDFQVATMQNACPGEEGMTHRTEADQDMLTREILTPTGSWAGIDVFDFL